MKVITFKDFIENTKKMKIKIRAFGQNESENSYSREELLLYTSMKCLNCKKNMRYSYNYSKTYRAMFCTNKCDELYSLRLLK